jgi:Flp pilus assembly protein TadG
MGIFLIGALGFAVDGATLFGHRQMAQVAADAAAQAAILSIFNGTNTGGNAFASSTTYTHTCTTNRHHHALPACSQQRLRR